MTRRQLISGMAAGMIGGTILNGRIVDAALSPASVVTGPISGGRHGRPFAAFFGGMDAKGYVEHEYFLTGEATRYTPLGKLAPDGKWDVKPMDTTPYTTRVIVRRPRDPVHFNGTLILEWINVSVGFELTTIGNRFPGIYDDGFAYAAVSCQRVGVYGFSQSPQGLKAWDPDRYNPLSIPSDALSFDIFTQAGRALGSKQARSGVDPLGGLSVRNIIATGASQSAIRLRAYLNAIQPRERVFNAAVTTIDLGAGSGFDDFVYDPTLLPPDKLGRILENRTRVREDLATPVMVVNSEFETPLYLPMRQPDSEHFRFWEVAGASHAPAPSSRESQKMWTRDGMNTEHGTVAGSEVDWTPTADAAFHHVRRWINGGVPPPSQKLIEVQLGTKPLIIRDEFGNARGGVRLPEVEVPIARYLGEGDQPGMGRLAGSTTPLSPEVLKRLYPTREAYLSRVQSAALVAEAAGVIRPWRVGEYIEAAKSMPLPV